MDSTFITCGTNYTSSELSLLTITHNNTLFTMTDLTINDTLGTVVRHDTTFGAGVSINLVRVAIRNCSSVTSEYGVIAAITGAFSSNTFSNPFVLNVIDSIITSNTFTKHPVITLTSTCRLQVTLRNSTFSDNSVENNNGGVLELSLSTVGSSLCAERPSISILNSNFLRNSAKYIQTQDGGFGFGSGSGSSTAITTGRGGSIYFTSTFNNIVPPPIISIANTTCSGGVAQESGSFFYSLSSTDIRIQNSVFTSNSAGRSSGSSFFGSSESTGNGGVFYTGDTSSITFSSSICSQNTALLAGGCFYSGTLSNFSAFASTFELNSARTGGAFDSGSVLFTKISNVIFRRNSASSEGGALRIAGVSGYCSLRLSLGNFSSNSADRAGSLYVDSCSADISDSVFSDEKSSNFAGGSMYSASTDLNLRNCVFLRCSSERSGGGALYAASGFKQTNISSSSFVGCSCSQSGSAIYIDLNHKAFIWDSLISGNTVIGFGGPGGALFVTGSTSAINLYRSNVTLNTAAMNGGGVHVNANSFFTAENCNFVSNSASGAYGGGIYADQLSNAVIRNSLFLSNFAYLQGGAMYAAAKSKFEVYGSTIQSSIATKGAALYLTAGSSGDPMHYFFNCTFRDHNDDRILYGGAIYALTGLLLEETRVVSNIASEQGGAIYSDSYNVTLFKSEISSNSVSSLGGGIYLLGGQFFLNRATVGSNYARLSGGGIYVKQRANLTLVDSSISNNNGARSGGGIFMEAAQLSITGSLVERNTANQGGGVYTSVNSSVSVDSSRFVGNIGGTGGAFYSLGWPGSFRNSNFTENAARDKSGSCGTAIGTGGSIYVDYFDCSSTNLSVLIDSVFMRNNTAVKFGAGISFSTIVDVSKRCNYSFFASLFSFSSNQANYGSNVSTGLRAMVPSFTSITVWSADTDNSLGLRMYDHFGFGVVGDTCDINIVILNSTNRGLLQFGLPMPYRTILNANNLIKYFFVFGASEYPQVDLPVNLSLKVTVLSQVSYLNTTVNLCRSGQKFQKDSIRFWACADCISGTRVSRYFNECIECSAGYYSFSRSTSCSGCIPGTSSSSASPRCVACPEGKYSDKPLQANCVDCPSGKYGVQGGNGSFCYDCPFNAITISAGCPSITSCICSKGSFGAPYLNKPCKSCPLQNGVTCNDDSPLPFVAAGYWRDPEDEAHILDSKLALVI
jgi:predicted outer membrane repeat protein